MECLFRLGHESRRNKENSSVTNRTTRIPYFTRTFEFYYMSLCTNSKFLQVEILHDEFQYDFSTAYVLFEGYKTFIRYLINADRSCYSCFENFQRNACVLGIFKYLTSWESVGSKRVSLYKFIHGKVVNRYIYHGFFCE